MYTTAQKIEELKKVAEMEQEVINRTAFDGKLYVATSLDVISPKNCTKEVLKAFLTAFPPLETCFYKDSTAGIDTLDKIQRPHSIKSKVLGGIWIDCQNEKYGEQAPKIKWKAIVNGNPVSFWAEMAPGAIEGVKVFIETLPSEYEKGKYERQPGKKFEAPIFRPLVELEKCSFYGGHVYHFATTQEQHEALTAYLNI